MPPRREQWRNVSSSRIACLAGLFRTWEFMRDNSTDHTSLLLQKSLTILFSGMIAGDPWQGGATWAVLQFVLGLRRLGHDVWFVEPVAAKSLQPSGDSPQSESAAYF